MFEDKRNLTIGFDCSQPSFPTVFKLVFPGGYVVDYHTILPFYSPDTGKYYVIYTDRTIDEDGDMRVYASVFNPDSLVVSSDASMGAIELGKIKTEEEWAVVEELVSEMDPLLDEWWEGQP